MKQSARYFYNSLLHAGCMYSILGALLIVISACESDGNRKNNDIVADFPIAYIVRDLQRDENDNIISLATREPLTFQPGAKLLLREKVSPTAREIDLSSSAFAADSLYDIKDLNVSNDGSKLIFAMRAPEVEDADDDEQPTWNIWQYDITNQQLSRVISSDIKAEGGQDISPAFLADGRIIFSSTRQRRAKAILLDENKPQFTALVANENLAIINLHIMDSDGGNIEQVTFNPAYDLNPLLLDNGQIIFSRWDLATGSNDENNGIHLYKMNPDGTELELLYGYDSHTNEEDAIEQDFFSAKALPNGGVMISLKRDPVELYSVQIASIDYENYVNNTQGIWSNQNPQTPAQQLLSPADSSISSDVSIQGRVAAFYPLFDGSSRFIMSWSPCRLIIDDVISACTSELIEQREADSSIEEAPPLFSLWVYDALNNIQLPITEPEEGIMYSEIAVAEPKSTPVYIESNIDKNLSTGILNIRSVYDQDGEFFDFGLGAASIAALSDPLQYTADDRPARFLKFVKAVSLPNNDVLNIPGTAFGPNRAQGMREILGYVPIEPDGSVKAQVPSDVSFSLSIVDQYGRRIYDRHANWLQVRPGETMQCIGCHDNDSDMPHGRAEARPPSINIGAAEGQAFTNTHLIAPEEMPMDACASALPCAEETMAEYNTRLHGVPQLSQNLNYVDYWSATPEPSLNNVYASLETPQPVETYCETNWSALCRITIDYQKHIHPLWNLDRKVFDTDGTTLLRDDTCTSCHTRTNAREDDLIIDGSLQIPPGQDDETSETKNEHQIELTDGASADETDHLLSYRELLFNDNKLSCYEDTSPAGSLLPVPTTFKRTCDVNEELVDLLNIIPGAFVRDENGNLILDPVTSGPIPDSQAVSLSAVLNSAGAIDSADFFDVFLAGGSHETRLTKVELRLIAEWIDIGGQYYNNPFDVPQN